MLCMGKWNRDKSALRSELRVNPVNHSKINYLTLITKFKLKHNSSVLHVLVLGMILTISKESSNEAQYRHYTGKYFVSTVHT